MPDLILVFSKKWKFILGLTLVATLVGAAATLLSPKKFLSTSTALPANSVLADKARIFNPNIEALYSDFGSPDELDRMEGTAVLDTIFIATAKELDLPGHYGWKASEENNYRSALKLKKQSRISRSAYGELKVKVWDEDRHFAALLSNSLMNRIQELHQHLQNESSAMVLQKIREDMVQKQEQFSRLLDSIKNPSRPDTPGNSNTGAARLLKSEVFNARLEAIREQLKEDEKLVNQYQFALNTNPPVLLIVEKARASLWPDKPKVLATILFILFGSFLFSFLLALFMESRKKAS